jgi:hypothetical protein
MPQSFFRWKQLCFEHNERMRAVQEQYGDCGQEYYYQRLLIHQGGDLLVLPRDQGKFPGARERALADVRKAVEEGTLEHRGAEAAAERALDWAQATARNPNLLDDEGDWGDEDSNDVDEDDN